jgi:hypothetical protein
MGSCKQLLLLLMSLLLLLGHFKLSANGQL